MCAWKLPARSDYKYTAPHSQDVVHMGGLRCSERLEIRRFRACCHRLADFGGHAGGPSGKRLGSHLAWGRLAADIQPYRQVAIFQDLQLWRSPSNSQLLLYKAPKLTLVLNVEMVTGTRDLLLNLSNMAGNSAMELDFPWTVKLTGKYLRKQALVSLRMRSILRCSQELKLIGKHGEILDQQVILKPGNVSKLYKAHKKRLRTKTDIRRLSVNL